MLAFIYLRTRKNTQDTENAPTHHAMNMEVWYHEWLSMQKTMYLLFDKPSSSIAAAELPRVRLHTGLQSRPSPCLIQLPLVA